MSRDRMTRRGSASRAFLAEIDKLERLVKADDEEEVEEKVEGQGDEELDEEAEEIGQEDEKETEAPAEAGMDQNERAMKNWPMSASEKLAVAKRLVAMAKHLIE